MRAALAALVLLLPVAAPPRAAAQMESREGIALQNQILQLRQEMEQLRRGGAAGGGGGSGTALGGFFGGTASPPGGRGGAQGEVVGALLERVTRLEEETRTLRGRLDDSEFRNRQLNQEVEKLRGDLDYRMQQIEGTGGAPAPPPRPTAPPTTGRLQPPPIAAPPPTPPAPVARTPERALADGQAALSRQDYAAAEAAAREVLAARNSPRAYDARFLLAEAEAGQRSWQQAAIAYGDAYRANQRGSRAAEALVGFGTSLANLNQRREACEAFALAQSEFPNLRGPLRDRLEAGRQRAGCR